MTKRTKRVICALSVILAVVIAFYVYVMYYYSVSVCVFASTASYTYTDVLDDLEEDESFSASDYPIVLDDYSLSVITLAESEDNELFVYVYQPSGKDKDFTASSINISIDDISSSSADDTIRYYNYGLIKLSSSGTLYKYLVEDFTVTTEAKRYYSISSIYRPFDDDIDEQADYDNKISEVPYSVGIEYFFSTTDGKIEISSLDIETIAVTDKYVFYVRCCDGFNLFTYSSNDVHFVAFNTDRDIDDLLEADVYYVSQDWKMCDNGLVVNAMEYGDEVENYAYLRSENVYTYTGDGLFAATFEWNEIESVEDFLSDDSLKNYIYKGALLNVGTGTVITDEGLEALEGMKWVLCFAATDYSSSNSTVYIKGTMVSDVTILRLKFITDGVTYNLGVVDNKQTGSDNPINGGSEFFVEASDGAKHWITIILIIICLLVFVFLFVRILETISDASEKKKINDIYQSTNSNKRRRRKRRKRK